MKRKDNRKKEDLKIFHSIMKKNYKKYITIFIAMLFVMTTFVSIGFSALNQNLNISGDIDFEKMIVWAENLFYNNSDTGVKCRDTQCMLDCLLDERLCPERMIEVGDYFRLVPTKTSYSISTNLTGYTDNQTINPSELTLWRAIKINEDNSIDAVSEYVSSVSVIFKGTIGYAKYIGSMQTIAQQYSKTNYTQSARMMGYDGQTATITNTIMFDGNSSDDPYNQSTPSPTTGTGEEYALFSPGDRGDTLYLRDYQLVQNAYGNAISNQVGTSVASNYWIASRRYSFESNDRYMFLGRVINNSGNLTSYYVIKYEDGNWAEFYTGLPIRPIITIKPNLSLSEGTGSKTNPYIFD